MAKQNTHVLLFVENKSVVGDVGYLYEGEVKVNGKEYALASLPDYGTDFKLVLESDDLAAVRTGEVAVEVTYYYVPFTINAGDNSNIQLETDQLGDIKVYSQKLG